MGESPLRWYARLTWGYFTQSFSLSFRRATARWRAVPNFFILGAPKCGTTSLSYALALHPAYVPSFIKELNFLQDLPHFRSTYERNALVRLAWGNYGRHGLDSYRKFFPLERSMRAAAKRNGVVARTGDHTPFYLYCPTAAERIKSFCPEARLIIMMREPVSRAYSDYTMIFDRVPDENRTFEQAIDDELTGKNKWFGRTYLHKGVYEPHVRRWLSLFPKEQLMVIESGRYFKDPASTIARACEFLGWPDHQPKRDPKVQNKGTYSEPIQAATKERLKEYYRPHNERLFELLGDDFGWNED